MRGGFAGGFGLLYRCRCQMIGVAADRALGGPTVKAKYVPEKNDPMLVFVESYGLVLDSGIESEHMTLSLQQVLEDNKMRRW